ncbi:hypothetical protein [Carnobacterium sp. ISL-102]|uniref:hypothetical protein n=1 Tax=Carnobacterium sp. ISL-102 TaxID=2819142 RepID=UPI001BE87CFA|nr:hypothetical protein [Carnobacterium sp. ISL-102]MBT2731646.1 hypothetical protein [Carnobacterium sp. ISL-102]
MEKVNMHELIFKTLLDYKISGDANPQESYSLLYKLICENFIIDGKLTRIRYDIIAKYVFVSSEGYTEDNEVLNENLQKIIELSEEPNEKNILIFADKFKGHYKLSKEQKEYIQDNIENLNAEVLSARKEVNGIKTIVSETESRSKEFIKDSRALNEEMSKTKDKLLSEFVGILGIFSALIFGLFGGFEALSTSVALIANNTSLGKTIMTSSAVMIALTSFTYAMMQWVGKLIDKPIKSCGCLPGDDCKNKHSFADRHATYLIVISIIVLFFLLGTLIMVGKSSGITNSASNLLNGYALFGIISIIIIATLVFLIIKIFKKSTLP